MSFDPRRRPFRLLTPRNGLLIAIAWSLGWWLLFISRLVK
jgi:hypothetical protein